MHIFSCKNMKLSLNKVIDSHKIVNVTHHYVNLLQNYMKAVTLFYENFTKHFYVNDVTVSNLYVKLSCYFLKALYT